MPTWMIYFTASTKNYCGKIYRNSKNCNWHLCESSIKRAIIIYKLKVLIVPSEKLSSEKPGQLSHSGLRSLECVHFFFEINASGFWHCQVVYSLSSVLYTLEVYSDSLNGTRPLCACTTKLSLLARVTNPRFECSRLHTLIHSHIRTNVYQHVGTTATASNAHHSDFNCSSVDCIPDA